MFLREVPLRHFPFFEIAFQIYYYLREEMNTMVLITAVYISLIFFGILHFIFPDLFWGFYEVFDIQKVILWKYYTEKIERANCIFAKIIGALIIIVSSVIYYIILIKHFT